MTSDELKTIYESDQNQYTSEYQGADITVEGVIVSIKEDEELFYPDMLPIYKIRLNGGWGVTVLQDDHDDVSDLRKGDNVLVQSELSLPKDDYVDLGYFVLIDKIRDGTIITKK